jgi:hypothetical protein
MYYQRDAELFTISEYISQGVKPVNAVRALIAE